MEVTDDERRRVAAALRRMATKHDGVASNVLEIRLGLESDDRFLYGSVFTSDSVNRLANLIDPDTTSDTTKSAGDTTKSGPDTTKAPTSSDTTATHTDASATCDMSQSRRDTVACDPTGRGVDSIYDWCRERLEGADGAEDELYCAIMRAIEDYRHPELVAARTVRPVDREALLAVAEGLEFRADELIRAAQHARFSGLGPTMDRAKHDASELRGIARRIREACGEAVA